MESQKRAPHGNYFTVEKSQVVNTTIYNSRLEFNTLPSVARKLFQKEIRHPALEKIHPIALSSNPHPRVANVSFQIRGNVAEMEHYFREGQTPLSANLRLNTLIIAANDLKAMGCDTVVTHVFTGKQRVPGRDNPVKMKIDDWLGILHTYKSPAEFAGYLPL